MKRSVVEIDSEGNLVLPSRITSKFGLVPGSRLLLEEDEDHLILSRSTHNLNRIYIEVSNQCNMSCTTCIRNQWDVPYGRMNLNRFEQLILESMTFQPRPEIFFGGYGEPLSHPDIIRMIRTASSAGFPTALISNGTLLDEAMSEALAASGLDMLWVSMDGATRESYREIRTTDQQAQLVRNLAVFHSIRAQGTSHASWSVKPRLGIAFVLMKKNAAELAELVHMGTKVGATHFYITNVLAYSQDLEEQITYSRSLQQNNGSWEGTGARIWLPRLDLDGTLQGELGKLLHEDYQIRIAGNILNRNPGQCPFAVKGAAVVRWDGEVSPCLSLLYAFSSRLPEWKRSSRPHSFGNVFETPLPELWMDSAYVDFRRQLLEMSFSPCVQCQTCELAENNEVDCFGNQHPTCGGCLWAEGVIQCP